MEIQIKYDWEPYALCGGSLTVIIDGKVWKFPYACLESGGGIAFNEEGEATIEEGEWTIPEEEWPENFPEELKKDVLYEINKEVPLGCCGGCI